MNFAWQTIYGHTFAHWSMLLNQNGRYIWICWPTATGRKVCMQAKMGTRVSQFRKIFRSMEGSPSGMSQKLHRIAPKIYLANLFEFSALWAPCVDQIIFIWARRKTCLQVWYYLHAHKLCWWWLNKLDLLILFHLSASPCFYSIPKCGAVQDVDGAEDEIVLKL